MPELPEAENICRALDRALTGRTIAGVKVFSPAMRTPLTPLLHAGLPGRRFVSVRRRGRYVIAALDDNRGLVMHFGMSGVVRVESGEIPKRKHEHVHIALDNGLIFKFECTRRFSLLEACALDCDGIPEMLRSLGPEPLTGEWNSSYLLQQTAKRKGSIKNVIMDNAVIVGIGNIYANETLFAAKVNPQRPANTLTADECEKIVRFSKEILKRAIAAGGSTISDFLNVDGSEGKFSRELQIYGKAGLPCPICGTHIECVRIGGRSSFFCPKCQK